MKKDTRTFLGAVLSVIMFLGLGRVVYGNTTTYIAEQPQAEERFVISNGKIARKEDVDALEAVEEILVGSSTNDTDDAPPTPAASNVSIADLEAQLQAAQQELANLTQQQQQVAPAPKPTPTIKKVLATPVVTTMPSRRTRAS